VIGKFYPPHEGHRYLIETALAQSDELVILVCEHPDQSISGVLRAAWLSEIHPNAKVSVIPDLGHDDDSEFWARHTVSFLGYVPDVVFTSEAYGETWAAAMRCEHVCVDRPRTTVPISATAIRKAPFAHWNRLAPCVRAHFVKRVAIVGAESTGTTTMSEALAAHYETEWVPEYGREYWIAKMARGEQDSWQSAEFEMIAREQCYSEDRAARKANKLLICDSPAFVTTIWHERYLGSVSPAVDAIAAPYTYPITFVTAPDFDFVQDGYRDGEHIRDWMDARIRQWLSDRDRPFTLLTGSHTERFATAVRAIDSAMALV
jgi:NadR type nicotinamide-nucleotide adenylyltransferase